MNSFAETIIIKCERNYYKYVSDGNSAKAYQSLVTKKNDWWEFPKTKVQDDNKHIFMIVDLLGRPAYNTKNQTLIYIYNDGKIQKKFIK